MRDTHGIAMMHLTKSGMEETEFIVPPLELQKQVVSFVAQVDKSKSVVQKSLEETQLLFDSLMQTDFDLDKPFSLEINYQHETQPNDTLSVLRKQDNDATWFQIMNSRGVSVTAKITVNK